MSNALASPKNFAVFMDGPACGKVREIYGRPNTIQVPVPKGLLVYKLSRAYGESGMAAIFYHQLKGVG